MKITERELFDFVFFPENLPNDKVEYLKNFKEFDDEIKFYHSVKDSFDEELREDIKQKIAERIPIYIPAKIFFLFPVKKTVKEKNGDVTVLAAASPKEKPSVKAKTFIDESNHYLIRLLNFKDSSKIYVFSTTEEVLRNYKVKIKPSGQTFEQSDNSTAIEINSPIEAENIELQFN